MTRPAIVPPGIAAKTLDCGFIRESVYSRRKGIKRPKASSSSGFFFLRRERLKTQNNSRQKTPKSHASSLNTTLHSGGHAPPHQTVETPHLNLDWTECPARKLQRALAAAQDNIVHHLSLQPIQGTFSPNDASLGPDLHHPESAAPGGSPVTMEWRHQCGVHSKLRTPKKGQAINNDLQPTTITWIRCSNVQVTNHDVGRDPPTCFSAHASARTFQSETTPPQLTCPRASCVMVAKGVKGTATSAEAGGQRQTDEGGAGATHGTSDSQSCCGYWKVQRREPLPLLGHSAI